VRRVWVAAEEEQHRKTLTQKLISRVGRTDGNKPMGLYFLSSEGDWAPLARFVERAVFFDRFGNDESVMHAEYDRFEPHSLFILAVDHAEAEPVGMIRIVQQSKVGLKTLLDVESTPGWGASREEFLRRHCAGGSSDLILDVATLAVRDDWTRTGSGMLTAAALYGGVYRCAHAIDSPQVVATLDVAVADLLTAVDVPLEPICELPAIEYLGSPQTRPYVIQVGLAETLMRSNQKLSSVLMGGLVEHDFSLPPIDLANPNPHPTEIEPQFIHEPISDGEPRPVEAGR